MRGGVNRVRAYCACPRCPIYLYIERDLTRLVISLSRGLYTLENTEGTFEIFIVLWAGLATSLLFMLLQLVRRWSPTHYWPQVWTTDRPNDRTTDQTTERTNERRAARAPRNGGWGRRRRRARPPLVHPSSSTSVARSKKREGRFSSAPPKRPLVTTRS